MDDLAEKEKREVNARAVALSFVIGCIPILAILYFFTHPIMFLITAGLTLLTYCWAKRDPNEAEKYVKWLNSTISKFVLPKG